MHKKQYGKMTVSAWLASEMERSNPFVMLTVGVLPVLAGIPVRIWVGSPYRTILLLGIDDRVPPVWLMMLCWTVALFTVGCAAGFVFAYRACGRREEKYKGCMFFILLAVLEFCWYPAFFGAQMIFLSALLAIACLCVSLAATFSFYRVTKFAGMIFLLHDIWLIYMMILNFAILFQA